MKFEVVIVVWDDGVFESRDRIISDNTDDLKEQFEIAVDRIVTKLDEKKAKRYSIGEDDDIPF
jgi:predicted RecB family endonuclease